MTKKIALLPLLLWILLASPAGAQPIPGDPAAEMNHVLGYASMAGVRHRLRVFQTHSNGWVADGWDVVRMVLWDYDPTLPNQDVERHVAARLRRFVLPTHADRVYFANVAHMIWLEWRSHLRPEGEIIDFETETDFGPTFGPTGTLTRPQARVGWSLRDYTSAQIQTYLLGPTWKSGPTATDPSYPGWSTWSGTKDHNYHFKHYKNAQAALDRMVSFHPDVEHKHASAVSRLVEWAGDRFQHFYGDSTRSWGMAVIKGDRYWGNQQDQDLSEAYQRRLGGCGTSSAAVVLLARALNVPAAVDLPLLGGPSAGQRDAHRHAYFPTLSKPWIHGDGILSGGSMGLLADDLFWTAATIAANGHTSRGLFRFALREQDQAKYDLLAARGVFFASATNLARSNKESRSIWADTGFVNTNADWSYVRSRYEDLSPTFPKDPVGPGYLAHVPDQKIPLLDEVAAHWTLDGGTGHEIHDSMLARTDGEDLGQSLQPATDAVKGNALHFHGKSFVHVPDQSTLRRNDEELTLSLWVRPGDVDHLGSILFRRGIVAMDEERELPSYDFAYSLELNESDALTFRYQVEGSEKIHRVEAHEPLLRGEWNHVVVTYDSKREVLLWVNGQVVGGAAAAGPLPMAYTKYVTATKRLDYYAYPAMTVLGLSFQGDLDDVILYYGALEMDEVLRLYDGYLR